jgi:hypothetical protein
MLHRVRDTKEGKREGSENSPLSLILLDDFGKLASQDPLKSLEQIAFWKTKKAAPKGGPLVSDASTTQHDAAANMSARLKVVLVVAEQSANRR